MSDFFKVSNFSVRDYHACLQDVCDRITGIRMHLASALNTKLYRVEGGVIIFRKGETWTMKKPNLPRAIRQNLARAKIGKAPAGNCTVYSFAVHTRNPCYRAVNRGADAEGSPYSVSVSGCQQYSLIRSACARAKHGAFSIWQLFAGTDHNPLRAVRSLFRSSHALGPLFIAKRLLRLEGSI